MDGDACIYRRIVNTVRRKYGYWIYRYNEESGLEYLNIFLSPKYKIWDYAKYTKEIYCPENRTIVEEIKDKKNYS